MISNEEIIYNKLLEVYPDAISTITQLSYNDNDRVSFIHSEATAFNYDSVVNCHPECENKEKSPDALFLRNETLYFVEFKDGKTNKEDIRLKIHEGVSTLYSFVRKHIHELSRDDFFNLNIKYALIYRSRNSNHSSFAEALEATGTKYHLRNLDGYIIKKTRVASCPNNIFSLLEKISGGAVQHILISNRDGNPLRVPAAQ
ncbi:TPA: hypothetical protein JAJ28_001590 [Aeromonas hydrophila]|uniref:Uncharacterized protein n=1 Tax=Aeromonas hydrophila TaxID=644 RepID=A0AAD3U9T1_AERHY|nr:hypothetical protein [Aeromonas hydrophila]